MNPVQSTTTPYGLPWGNLPKNAHKTARELDNRAMNSQTMFLWQMRLYELAMSAFEWENLPEGINERQIEWWLLRDGFCVFLHDEDIALDPVQRSPEGYAIMQCMLEGDFDIYSQPVNRIAYSVMGINIPLTIENSVIIWNSNLRVPTWFALNMYAKKLWAIDRAIDVNVYQQKIPRVVKCSQKQRLSFENMMAQVDEYKPLIMTDKDFDLESIDILDNSSPYVAEQLYELKDKYWKEALGFLGIASSESKSERQSGRDGGAAPLPPRSPPVRVQADKRDLRSRRGRAFPCVREAPRGAVGYRRRRVRRIQVRRGERNRGERPMSKYSLQLRWLVEQTLADAKLPNIEANWHAAYDKLGLADYPIFDETYRETLNNKIIRHYWAYEIGSETSGLFRWNLRDAMFMIMPYYNQMYLSEITAKGIQPLIDHTRTITEDATGTASNNANTSATSTSNAQDIFSDTPMSALNFDNIKAGNYASTADFTDASTTDSGKSDSSGSYDNKLSRTETGHDKAEAELLLIWRDTFVNIDRDVVEDKALRECFMTIW